MPELLYETKPSLLLLLEALEREQGPHDPHAVRVSVSEYTMDVARHAKECLPELRALFPDRFPKENPDGQDPEG